MRPGKQAQAQSARSLEPPRSSGRPGAPPSVPQALSSVQLCPWGTGRRAGATGAASLRFLAELVYFLRTVTLDPGVCPSLGKDGAPRCALDSDVRPLSRSDPADSLSYYARLLCAGARLRVKSWDW
ncbi:acylphosphatase-1 isoform X2 [Rousettus aegyptiacus]|uniref:acylphosphatase-1 isoform X2 n=1 Tax=Rousettus aegyptiacus TaxID=9407 RepID=UPI00168D361E|nr:acylphosphatase-1 isoform X2 [Rousettus aegyptiacus]